MAAAEKDVVLRALGAFGPWQARGALLLALVKIPAGWHMLSVLFLAPPPHAVGGRFWCSRPSPQWGVDEWLEVSHPRRIMLNGKDGYYPCQIYDLDYPICPTQVNSSNSQASKTPHPSTTRRCSDFEFEQDYPSIVTTWSLVCDRAQLANVVQLAYLVGILFGAATTMLLLKKVSPRSVVLLGAVLQITAGVASAFAPYYELHLAFKTLTGLGACIMFTAGFQICWDITGSWQRVVVCVSYEHFWSIGVISLGWLSDLCGSWVTLQVVISVPTVLVLLLAWWIPDSPRWLIASGHVEEAEEILRAGAAMNNNYLPEDFRVESPSAPPIPTSSDKVKLPKDKVVALLILWMITVYNYYGALLNMKNIGGPRLPIRTTLAALAEVLGASMGCLLLLCLRAGRRFAVLAALLAVGGSACLSSWALPPNAGGGRGGWPLLWLALTGRVTIACSLAVLSCGGCAELLPVPRRPLTMLSLVTAARLGLQSAPFMNTLSQISESVSLGVYGGLTLLGSCAALYLSVVLTCCEKEERPSPGARLIENMLASSQPSVWSVDHPYISTIKEDRILGLYFNPCFVGDSPEHSTHRI